MKTKPRILVLRGGAIGDFILTLPAIRALRRRWPDAHLEIIGYPHIADLALADGFVDCVISLDKAEMARFFSPNPAIPEAQAETIRSFDLIVSYLYDPDETVRRNLLSVGARQVVYRSPKVEQVHAVDHLFKALEELAIYPEGVEYPVLELKADHRGKGRERIARFGRDVVALHPGSGSPRRTGRWIVLWSWRND